MKKNMLAGLILIAISSLLLIFNTGEVEINLLATSIEILKPLAFLLLIADGVAIGMLLS